MKRSNWKVYKDKKGDSVWWVDNGDNVGEILFTFDRKKVFNLFRDYPHKLSPKEWLTFNAENEYWEKFFEDRNSLYEIEHHEEIERLKRGGE